MKVIVWLFICIFLAIGNARAISETEADSATRQVDHSYEQDAENELFSTPSTPQIKVIDEGTEDDAINLEGKEGMVPNTALEKFQNSTWLNRLRFKLRALIKKLKSGKETPDE